MGNCLAGQWGRVRKYEQLIVALEAEDPNLRANAALEIDGEGSWHVKQIQGPGNSSIVEASALHASATSLAHWMSTTPSDLNQAELHSFELRHAEMRKHIDVDSFNALAIQGLPLPLRDQVMVYLPGAGSLENRIKRAILRAQRLR